MLWLSVKTLVTSFRMTNDSGLQELRQLLINKLGKDFQLFAQCNESELDVLFLSNQTL